MKDLSQIKSEYGDFHDALIVDFKYDSGFNFETKNIVEDKIYVSLSCFNLNKEHNNSNELVEIICTEINYFNIRKYESMIFQALLEKNENGYVIDFDPIITTDRETGNNFISKENENSSFIIECNKIELNVIWKEM